MKKWLILFLLLIPLVSAQPEDYNNYSSVTIDVTISSNIERTQGQLNELITKLTFFPKQFGDQDIIFQEFNLNPEGAITENDDGVVIRWTEQADVYEYEVKSVIKTQNEISIVRDKIKYPTEVPTEATEFTLASEFIDITSDINTIAETIVGGEDDLYQVAFKLADWTRNNIQYNLSTLTADAVQKSSWVLVNRQGVCDEMTNLYISMLRSRGIPARFVSGLVYTNTLNDFGAHGWAEVYIDGQWVPVDPTFGTFGWIDPGHIKFKHSLDSGEASVMYEWSGNKIEMKPGSFDIDAAVVTAEGKEPALVDLEIEPLQDKVGPGSYIPIQITVKNKNDFYVPIKLIVTKAPGLVEENTKLVLLEPKEEQQVFWTAVVGDDTEDGKLYTTEVEVMTMLGQTAGTFFTFGNSYDTFTQRESNAIIDSLSFEEDSEFLEDVELGCITEREVYRQSEEARVRCVISGDLDGTEVCFEDECYTAAEVLEWDIDTTNRQSQRLLVSAQKGDMVRSSFFDLRIIGDPVITISNIEPKSIQFQELTNFKFDIDSSEPIENVQVKVGKYSIVNVENLEGTTHITVPVSGRQVNKGIVTFEVTYEDQLGKMFTYTTERNIEIENVPLIVRIWQSILNFFSF